MSRAVLNGVVPCHLPNSMSDRAGLDRHDIDGSAKS